MNKTILIAGGATVASLAVGAAGGYFFAKKRFLSSLPEIIEQETEALKKYHAIQMMEARSGKPASPADIPRQVVAVTEENPEDDPESELSEEDKKALERGRESLRQAKKHAAANRDTVDYQGLSNEALKAKTPAPEVKNIFDQPDPKRKQRPPRDDATGRYRKQTPREAENDPPEKIEEEVFLLNEEEYDQESLLYFVRDKTLVKDADPSESIDLSIVEEVNLTLFPNVPEDEPCMIFVRNNALQTMYEIKLMRGSLTEYLGLGEESEDNERGAAYL